jgi:hypothetical protein
MTRALSRGGVVRTARLTDLAAVGELSRRASHGRDEARSLGLPVAGSPISVFGLFALPLGAFRPSDRLYVHVQGGTVTGLARLELEPHDEATIVELDAIGPDAGDIRFRLVDHVLRDVVKRGVVRFHVACADAMDNVELFMQAGFIRYGEERLLYRPPGEGGVALSPEEVAEASVRPASALDAIALARLYAQVTPQPVVRLEAYRLPDWERTSGHPRPPRSSLAPLLRLSDLETYVREASGDGGGDGLDAFLQVGIAQAAQPHYLRLIALPRADARPLIRFALGVIAARTSAHRRDVLLGHRVDHGVLAPVRTYEAPLDSQLADAGFHEIGTVTLLMKETLARIAEPALVPAIQ